MYIYYIILYYTYIFTLVYYQKLKLKIMLLIVVLDYSVLKCELNQIKIDKSRI